MSRPRPPWTFAAMGLLYLALALVGRASVLDTGETSLVWPAAGVAVLWLLDQTARGRPGPCLVAVGALTLVGLAATGAPAALTVTVAVAACVQTTVAVSLLRRWCPPMVESAGAGGMHSTLYVGRAAAAVAIGTLVGAAVGGLGEVVETGSTTILYVASWWTRNATGAIVVGAAGYYAWEQARTGGARLVSRSRAAELALLLVVSAALYVSVFVQDGLPLAFLVLPPTVWIALRFPTVFAVIHTTLFGGAAVALTLAGRGPLGDITRPDVEVVVMQAFLLTTMMTVLTIATGRDERAALASVLAASERAATERAELLDAMTEAMTEGLAIVAPDGTVSSMNAACRVMLAHTPAGSSASAGDYELRYPNGARVPAPERPFARALRDGHVDPHDVHLVLADGDVRILSVTASALTRAGLPGALVVFRDVTRERRDRSELEAFAGTAAHDLRSPLTAIQGWLQLAALELGDVIDLPASAPVRDELDRISRGIAHADRSTTKMGNLIHELLVQATAEGRELRVLPIDLSTDGGLVAELVDLLPGRADVTVGAIPPVMGDAELLSQLMGNLLGNAVKYADPARPARVTVTGERVDHRVLIEVTDNGIGVPADQRQRVFDRFHRAHRSDTRFSGSGLGLALCRTVVERHGGIIECLEPVGGLGSRFRFDLAAAEGSSIS